MKKTNKKMKFVRHIFDTMVKVVQGLILKCKVLQVIVKTDGKHRDPPEGNMRLPVGGI